MVRYTESVAVKHGLLCCAGSCKSYESVVVNHGVLY
jgi:hypothetical protein